MLISQKQNLCQDKQWNIDVYKRQELANGVDSEHPALVAFKKHQNIETLNREILIDLVNYIKVYENGNISVKFKFADEFRRIAEYIEINISEIPAAAG